MTPDSYWEGKDFKDVQEIVGNMAAMNTNRNAINEAIDQSKKIAKSSFEEDFGRDIVEGNLEKFKNVNELIVYLSGPVLSDRTRHRIESFFMDENGNSLTLTANSKKAAGSNDKNAKSKQLKADLEFKRELLYYFKRTDDAIEGITKEQEKLQKAQEEYDKDMATVLNPLKDNILAYAEYLESKAKDMPETTLKEKQDKKYQMDKSYYIKCGYTFENLIELAKNPSIRKHAMEDFRRDSSLKDIGRRYQAKLNQGNITLNLFSFIGNSPEESLEFKVLPQGDYPAGLEGFTVVFMIRSLIHMLPGNNGQIFQSSAYIALDKLVNNKLDPAIKTTMQNGIRELLSYFKDEM